MKRHVFPVIFALVLIPLSAHAEQTVTWDFRKPEAVMPLVENLTTVEKTSDGLRIQTQQDGFIGWQDPPLPKTDVVLLYVKNGWPLEAAFMWQPDGAQPGELLQLFFMINEGDGNGRTLVVPSHYPEWTHETPALAFGFPAGTDIVIERIEWKSWNLGEKIANALRSFWTYDTVGQYSINFLWGPLLATNPETRATLYDALPPKDVSAMRAVYILLILAACTAGALVLLERKRAAALTAILSVTGLWLLLDIRMGTEILSYAVTDLRTQVLAPPGESSFRTLDGLPAILDTTEFALKEPIERDRVRTMLVLEPSNTYLPHVRLRLYPLSVLPYSESIPQEPSHAWLVIDRPDITVREGKIMDKDNRPLSKQGNVIANLTNTSFLFLEE